MIISGRTGGSLTQPHVVELGGVIQQGITHVDRRAEEEHQPSGLLLVCVCGEHAFKQYKNAPVCPSTEATHMYDTGVMLNVWFAIVCFVCFLSLRW